MQVILDHKFRLHEPYSLYKESEIASHINMVQDITTTTHNLF